MVTSFTPLVRHASVLCDVIKVLKSPLNAGPSSTTTHIFHASVVIALSSGHFLALTKNTVHSSARSNHVMFK